MTIPCPGKQTNIICKEQAIPEFPHMLFGGANDGISYFNATLYLQNTKSSSSVEDFLTQYQVQIEALANAYEIKPENICIQNNEGHFLIDGSLCYLFIAFVDPNFLAYMMDRINDMFVHGFCVSDTYVFGLAKRRLPKEALQAIINNGTN